MNIKKTEDHKSDLYLVMVWLLGVLVRGGKSARISANLTRDQGEGVTNLHLSLEDRALIKVSSPLIGGQGAYKS